MLLIQRVWLFVQHVVVEKEWRLIQSLDRLSLTIKKEEAHVAELTQREAELKKQVEDLLDDVKTKEVELNRLKSKQILLNVGGSHYTTTLATLRSDPSSMLAANYWTPSRPPIGRWTLLYWSEWKSFWFGIGLASNWTTISFSLQRRSLLAQNWSRILSTLKTSNKVDPFGFGILSYELTLCFSKPERKTKHISSLPVLFRVPHNPKGTTFWAQEIIHHQQYYYLHFLHFLGTQTRSSQQLPIGLLMRSHQGLLLVMYSLQIPASTSIHRWNTISLLLFIKTSWAIQSIICIIPISEHKITYCILHFIILVIILGMDKTSLQRMEFIRVQ